MSLGQPCSLKSCRLCSHKVRRIYSTNSLRNARKRHGERLYQEALDGWALCELIGHYVNYRKQVSPTMQDLLPEADFRLFAVCARYPQNLARQEMLTPLREGVYDVRVLHLNIRIVVVAQLPQQEQNAMLLLFSAKEELVRYAAAHYRPHSKETSTLLLQLLRTYREDPEMANKFDEFVRQTIDELLK